MCDYYSGIYNKKKCEKNANSYAPRAFWVIPDINGFTYPIELIGGLDYRAMNVPALKLFESEDFIEKEFFPGTVDAPGVPYKVLNYVGKKSVLFQFTNSTTFQNNGTETIRLTTILAKGSNGNPPNELITTIRKDKKLLGNGEIVVENATGLIRLDPQDTVTWFFKVDKTVPANTGVILIFNNVLTPVAFVE